MRWPVSALLATITIGCGSSPERSDAREAEAPPASSQDLPVPPREPDVEPPVEAPAPRVNAPPEPTAEPAPPTASTDAPEADAAPSPAEAGADGKSFTVVARVVDLGRPTPHCGVVHAVAVMKLEVVRVEDGRFLGDTLYIYVSCPEMLPSKTVRRLEEGTTYRMVLDARIHRRTAGAKYDAFREVAAPRYRLMRVLERVEAGTPASSEVPSADRCNPLPKAGDPCGPGDSWCVESWGEPGGWSSALWCREGRWVREQERNLPEDAP